VTTRLNRRQRAAALIGIGGLFVCTAPAGVQAAVSARSGAARSGSVRLGQVTLRRCGHNPRLAYCGHIEVPLDYSSSASPDIKIGFRWLPAASGAADEE
jgi:hypothetical protein